MWASILIVRIQPCSASLNGPVRFPFSPTPIKTLDEKPKLYLLGSSSWSASAAAALGLRYVVAGFINHKGAGKLLDFYLSEFKPATGESGVANPDSILSVMWFVQILKKNRAGN